MTLGVGTFMTPFAFFVFFLSLFLQQRLDGELVNLSALSLLTD